MLDNELLVELDDHSAFTALVKALMDLADTVTAENPFVIYKCHHLASFDLFLAVYRPGEPPLFVFIDNKSQGIRYSDLVRKKFEGWINIGFCIHGLYCVVFIEDRALNMPNTNKPPKGYRTG